MKFSVEITDAAFTAILAQAKYIAVENQAPINAARWLERVWDVIDGLEHMPKRHNFAAENAYRIMKCAAQSWATI